MSDFLWEADGPGVCDGKQPWRHREVDDDRLQRDQWEREKLICSGKESGCGRERVFQVAPVIIIFLLQQQFFFHSATLPVSYKHATVHLSS